MYWTFFWFLYWNIGSAIGDKWTIVICQKQATTIQKQCGPEIIWCVESGWQNIKSKLLLNTKIDKFLPRVNISPDFWDWIYIREHVRIFSKFHLKWWVNLILLVSINILLWKVFVHQPMIWNMILKFSSKFPLFLKML